MPRAPLAGSTPDHAVSRRVEAVDPATVMQATIVLRAEASTTASDLLAGTYDSSTHIPAAVDARVLDAVSSFVRAHGLTVVESDGAERRVMVRGPASLMGRAFGVTLA